MANPVVAQYLTAPGGLADRLRRLRTGAGHGVRAFGALTGIDPSKISKVERGHFIPRPDEIRAWAEHAGAADQTDDLLQARAEAEQFRVEHRTLGRPRSIQGGYNDIHAASSRITMVDVVNLPSVVQTVDYAATVIGIYYHQLGLTIAEDDLRRAAETRAQRSHNMTIADKTYRLIVAASAFHAIGDPAIAGPALDNLAAAAEHAQVVVVPTGAALIANSFAIFDGEVIIEPAAGPEIVHPAGSPIARQHLDLADHYVTVGLDRQASLDAIATVREMLDLTATDLPNDI